jgi:polysaccharide chain length determinant protein (PEP-CTERM system associated)
MHDVIQQVLGYAIAAWRRRWYALIVAWLVCLAGWVLVERIPDTYRSSARIYIDTQSMLDQLMGNLAVSINRSLLSELEVVRRSLTSRPNLEQVMRETDLDVMARTPADVERIIADLSAKLQVSRDRNNFFTINYVDSDPALAYNVVQSVLNIFIESNLGTSRDDMAVTTRFLDDQIRSAEEEMERLEQELTRFEMQNRGFLPGSENYEARLRAAQSTRDRLEQERQEAVAQRDQLNQDLARMQEGLRGEGPALSPRAQRVQQLETQINELMLRYTEQHPEVILTERLLEREREALARETATGQGEQSPLVEQTRSMINRQDAAIELYDQRIDQLQTDMAELSAMMEQTPAMLAEHRRLQREIDVVRSNHSALIDRRERLQFREEMEASVDSIQFRVVEPPSQPAEPSGPDRPLLRSAVLVGGLGAGAGFAFLLGLLANTVNTTGRLEQVTQRPTLGTVTRVRLPVQLRRRLVELTAFGVVLIGLIGTFVGVLGGHAGIALDRFI